MDVDPLFSDLPEDIQAGIRDLGWAEPMPVQSRVVPLLREGRDLIVQARTGSGKTGAFGVPIVERIDTDLAATQALIMAPTRELASQVAREVEQIGRHRGVRTLPIYGGMAYGPQNEGLREGAHVVVGTPGRLLDHLGAGRMRLDDLRILVFDEADELLSLGFWPDMREIRRYLPARRQSCLFSATIPEKVRSLARHFLTDPEFVTLSEDRIAPSEIEHSFVVTTAQEKDANLIKILELEDPESAIIFCNTKDDVRFVTNYLQRHGFDADQISGDLTQVAREQVMKRIKAGELRFLVATDVAARGIDISQLSHVISYSAPASPDVYVHRTGRTGRAGRAGVAISLISGLDIGNFKYLQNVNKLDIQECKLPSDAEILERVQKRLMVKAEQEMRAVPESERAYKIDRLVPVAQQMAASEQGLRDLAAILAAYLREHRPQTTVDAPAPAESGEAGTPPEARDRETSGAGSGSARPRRDERRGGDRPRRRRGRGRGR